MEKVIVMRDNLRWEEFIPFHARDLYHIEAYKTGYLHDVDVEIKLTLVDGDETPRGWDTIDQQLNTARKDMVACWELANRDYGYSHKKLY